MPYKALDSISVTDIEALGISLYHATLLHKGISQIIADYGASGPDTWMRISQHLLKPDLPFSFHQMMYYGSYKDFGPDPPAWVPEFETAVLTNVGQLLEFHGKELLGSKYKDPVSSFSDLQEFSVLNPQAYWKALLDEMGVVFSVPPQCILQDNSNDLANPGGEWLPGAHVNPAKNCLSTNCKKKLLDNVIIWRDETRDDLPVNCLTLEKLREEVWLVSFAIGALGLKSGSAIAIDMPLSVTSVVIFLAIILAGHVVASIADSFAPLEISKRLKISEAKAIFTQDFIIRDNKRIPLYSRVVEAQAPIAVVILSQGSEAVALRENDLSWNEFIAKVKESRGEEFIAIERSVDTYANILFSSGTTGKPKAIPWCQATAFKVAADAWCHMDVKNDDVICWPTNLGWMMGPWLIYASLINGASIAIFNGMPLCPGFSKFVQDAKVTILGVIPSMVRTWKNSNCTAGYDWSAIRCFASTGETSNPDENLWLMGRAHYKPVIEYCGGTEIGGAFVSGSLLQPQVLSAFSTPAMGCSLFILDGDGHPIPNDMPGIGELALDPVMFGASSKLLNDDHYSIYFQGMPTWNGKVLRRHGDLFERTSRGYFRAHGRVDDTMNLGGIKVSSVEIENVCNSVSGCILETAAIGLPPVHGGPELLVIAVVLKEPNPSINLNQLKLSFNVALQKELNPLFKVHCVVALPSLPRTATNKVMRRVLRQQLFHDGIVSKL